MWFLYKHFSVCYFGKMELGEIGGNRSRRPNFPPFLVNKWNISGFESHSLPSHTSVFMCPEEPKSLASSGPVQQ